MKPSLIPTSIDWQAVERDYRAGIMSLREMATVHGVSHVAIKKRADKEGWPRDLKAKIQARADEMVNRALVNAELTAATLVTERQIIDAGAQRIAQVRNEHRQDINRMRSLGTALLQELEEQTFDAVLLGQLGEFMRNPDDSGMDRLNDIYKKVISTPGRVDTAKKLVETMKSVIAMEREAYNIGTTPEEAAGTGVLAFLASMKRSALPAVHYIEADDDI